MEIVVFTAASREVSSIANIWAFPPFKDLFHLRDIYVSENSRMLRHVKIALLSVSAANWNYSRRSKLAQSSSFVGANPFRIVAQ